MKTFKEFNLTLNESIIDIPRKKYAPSVFDNADTNNPKLKSEVIGIIMKQFAEFKKEYPILDYSLIGSILTKRYRNDADLDINVLFDVPKEKQEEERVRLSKQFLSVSNPNNIQGKKIPGTKHPINYYFITDKKTYEDQNEKADAVFDIKNNKFIKRPDDFVFNVNDYIEDFNKRVQELDVIKGELKRDIIDYDELKELQPDDILNLQEKINEKLEEIENSIQDIVKIGTIVDVERRSAFDNDMSPDEIRKFGIKNRLPKNVIYKMLEKYHYLTFYKKCKKILEDGEVTDAEIDSLKEGTIPWLDTLVVKVKSLTTLKSRYQAAAKILQDVIDRKKKEAGGADKMRHDINYYAAKVSDTIKDIDARILGKMVNEQPELLEEAAKKSVAFTFGRFNPPTIGHEKLIKKVASVPATDYKIYLSRSQDTKKNPLSPKQKLDYMKDLFPQHAKHIEINNTNMVLDIATSLYNKGFDEISMVVGSDRVREFDDILKKYNNVRSRHGYYNFDKINVVSAGERDPDAEGAMGMSASKMRDAVSKGDLKLFKQGLPSGFKNSDKLFKDVRKGMNLAASYGGLINLDTAKPMASLAEFEQKQIRDLYIRDMIFNINDKVDYVKEDIKGKVVRRGTNYVVIEDNNNNLHKCWIWDCIPVASDKEAAIREYNLDVDYGFTAVSEKEIKMNDKDKKESYDIGHDYAQHTMSVTPGQPGYKPNYQGGSYKPSTNPNNNKRVYTDIKKGLIDRESVSLPTKEDVNKWSLSDETIDKYKQRYKEQWESKLAEAVSKMLKGL